MGNNLYAADNGADVLRVLLVGCKADVRAELAAELVEADMYCMNATTAAEAAALLQWRIPDFILLDWTLPGAAGSGILARLKADPLRHHIPVIALGADAIDDAVHALQAGADDFVAEPLAVREVVARIRAVRRRVSPLDSSESLSCGALRVDTLRRRVHLGERELMLGELEYRLLTLFLKRPDRAHSRAEILQWVWGGRTVVDERSIDARIRALRANLGEGEGGFGKYIRTVRGVGYCFAAGYELPVRSIRHAGNAATRTAPKHTGYLGLILGWMSSLGDIFVAAPLV
jgi:two-component system phosphate regulon response regulator PhoB